jgi:hypothetical protein
MRRRRFPILSRRHRRRSDRPEHKLVPPRLVPRHTLLCISALTKPCSTMLSTATSAPCTSATSTASLCSCTRFWAIRRMRTVPLFSGAVQTRGVSSHEMFHSGSARLTRIGRANAACILACYMVLIQSWPPHLALAPIAQMDPPCMPFRDAGYSQADYVLNIQDVIYGVWKAKEEGLCGLKDFSLEE